MPAVLFSWPVAENRTAADEREDAQRSRGGDRGAFTRLVERHQRAVYGLCARLLGGGDEARDAAQEAFVRAWEHRARFDPAQDFAPWVLRIARNASVDRLRRRRGGSADDAIDAVPDGAPPADEQLGARRSEAALEAAVAALPPRYRAAIELVHGQGRSVREAAAILDAPEGTVMTWLFRARRVLRDAIEGA